MTFKTITIDPEKPAPEDKWAHSSEETEGRKEKRQEKKDEAQDDGTGDALTIAAIYSVSTSDSSTDAGSSPSCGGGDCDDGGWD